MSDLEYIVIKTKLKSLNDKNNSSKKRIRNFAWINEVKKKEKLKIMNEKDHLVLRVNSFLNIFIKSFKQIEIILTIHIYIL